MTGIEMIAKERQEQIEKHGRTVERDVAENNFNQLTDGAIGILMTNRSQKDIPSHWSPEIWGKMIGKSRKERIIISAALLAAELDRMEATGETD